MTKKELEVKVERLEKEIEKLKAEPKVINHYHYTQPIFQEDLAASYAPIRL